MSSSVRLSVVCLSVTFVRPTQAIVWHIWLCLMLFVFVKPKTTTTTASRMTDNSTSTNINNSRAFNVVMTTPCTGCAGVTTTSKVNIGNPNQSSLSAGHWYVMFLWCCTSCTIFIINNNNNCVCTIAADCRPAQWVFSLQCIYSAVLMLGYFVYCLLVVHAVLQP